MEVSGRWMICGIYVPDVMEYFRKFLKEMLFLGRVTFSCDNAGSIKINICINIWDIRIFELIIKENLNRDFDFASVQNSLFGRSWGVGFSVL